MARRYRHFSWVYLLVLALVFSCTAGPSVAQPTAPAPGQGVGAACDPAQAPCLSRVTKIVFSSTRDNPTLSPLIAAEIYLMNPDTSDPIRLTTTAGSAGNAFAAISPDGKRIVFDSNRLRAADEPINTSDLFVMNTDGTGQIHVIRGSSASWSPDGKRITFRSDSDVWVMNADGTGRLNLTPNTPETVEAPQAWAR